MFLLLCLLESELNENNIFFYLKFARIQSNCVLLHIYTCKRKFSNSDLKLLVCLIMTHFCKNVRFRVKIQSTAFCHYILIVFLTYWQSDLAKMVFGIAWVEHAIFCGRMNIVELNQFTTHSNIHWATKWPNYLQMRCSRI